MTYTAPEGSREQALLRNLAAGLPLPRARSAAGYRDAAALARACDDTPGLEEACGEAEREGARARGEGGRAGAEAVVLCPRVEQKQEATDGVRDDADRGSGGMRGLAGRARGPDAPGDGATMAHDSEVRRVGGGPPSDDSRSLAPLKDDGPGVGGNAEPYRIVTASTPLHPEGGAATTPRGAEPTTPTPAVNESLRDLARRLERERVAEEAGRAVANDVGDSEDARGVDAFERIREEARALGGTNVNMGHLLWVERKRVDAGLHALDPMWLYHFEDFYLSDKMIDIGRFGVRAAKSDSVCAAIVAESVLMRRTLEPTIIGVCPVMSSNMREAGDRFETIKGNLRAIGMRDLGNRAPPDESGFKTSGGGNAALVIEMFDAQGHAIEFRIYPASESGAAGFTGIAGFGDELDLWGKPGGANPAGKTIRVLVSRYTTQPQAKLHLMSATYDRESEHARMIDNGDTARQRVARLGARGAAKDYAERLRLAASIMSSDPLLVAPPLPPDCPDIPCWVTNPIAPIEEAYKKADGNLVEMFALYGGRLALAGGGSMTLEDARFIAEQNRALSQPLGAVPANGMRSDGLLHVPGFDNDPGAGSGRYRGL